MSSELHSSRLDARRSDRLLSLIMIAISLGALWFSQGMSAMASVFPRTIATLVLLFSTMLLVRSFMAWPQLPRPEPGSIGRRLGLICVLLLWSLSLKWLGFIASSLISAGFLAVLAHYHAWTLKRIMGYAAILVMIIAAFYSLFAIILNVPLPVGQLWRNLL